MTRIHQRLLQTRLFRPALPWAAVRESGLGHSNLHNFHIKLQNMKQVIIIIINYFWQSLFEYKSEFLCNSNDTSTAFKCVNTWVLEFHRFFNIYSKWLWSLTNIHWKHLGVELPLLVTSVISYRCHLSREQNQLQCIQGYHSTTFPIHSKTRDYPKIKIFPSPSVLGTFAGLPVCSQACC